MSDIDFDDDDVEDLVQAEVDDDGLTNDDIEELLARELPEHDSESTADELADEALRARDAATSDALGTNERDDPLAQLHAEPDDDQTVPMTTHAVATYAAGAIDVHESSHSTLAAPHAPLHAPLRRRCGEPDGL